MQISTDPTDPDSHFNGTRGRKDFNVTKIATLYDTMANLDRKGLKYLIRVREHKGTASGLDLPDPEEFDMTEDTYVIPITNLDPEEFPLAELKKLYVRRRVVETSFRELKYTVGLLYFHSKKSQSILQEIWARLTMYNFTAFITDREAVHEKGKKYAYRGNIANAAAICRRSFRKISRKSCHTPPFRRRRGTRLTSVPWELSMYRVQG